MCCGGQTKSKQDIHVRRSVASVLEAWLVAIVARRVQSLLESSLTCSVVITGKSSGASRPGNPFTFRIPI